MKLYERVTGKALLISRTLGIDGRKLLRPDDAYEALREFNATYEGKRTTVEEMHLKYQALLNSHPGLSERLDSLPGSVLTRWWRGGGRCRYGGGHFALSV